MNQICVSLTAALLSLSLFLSGCAVPPAAGTAASFSLEDIPAYSGDPYVVIDDNQPDFPEEDRTSAASFESYSPLDALGRCGPAYANVCIDTMPTEERESIFYRCDFAALFALVDPYFAEYPARLSQEEREDCRPSQYLMKEKEYVYGG